MADVKWHSGVTTSQYKCPLKPKLIMQLSSLTGYSVLLLCRLLWSEAEVLIIIFIIVILSRGLLNVILNTKVIYSDFCINPLLHFRNFINCDLSSQHFNNYPCLMLTLSLILCLTTSLSSSCLRYFLCRSRSAISTASRLRRS